MVSTDNGLPEPDNPEDFTIATEGMFLETDDESDQESLEGEHDQSDQYESLPTSVIEESEEPEEPEEPETETEPEPEPIPSDEESFEASTDTDSDLLPFITPWSDVRVEKCDIEMDTKKIEEVRQAMMGITLPPGAIPDWAATIPEDDWKQQLYKRLEDMQAKEP